MYISELEVTLADYRVLRGVPNNDPMSEPHYRARQQAHAQDCLDKGLSTYPPTLPQNKNRNAGFQICAKDTEDIRCLTFSRLGAHRLDADRLARTDYKFPLRAWLARSGRQSAIVRPLKVLLDKLTRPRPRAGVQP